MTHLETKTQNTAPVDYILRPATLKDAHEIWNIMNTSYELLENKELFLCDDLDYVKDILSGHGFGVIAHTTDGNIVGNLLVKYPGLTTENLGYDVFITSSENSDTDSFCPFLSFPGNLPLLSKENLQKVIHMDSASVLPIHRGHHLESRMIAYAETLIDRTKYSYSLATVSPINPASKKSLESNGYHTIATKEKYKGVMRCIMLKILH